MKTLKRLALAIVATLTTTTLLAKTYTRTSTTTVEDIFGKYDIDVEWVFEDTVVDGKSGVKLVSIDWPLEDVQIPEFIIDGKHKLTVIELGDGLFQGWDMFAYTIPDHILKIGNGVFRDCTMLAEIGLGSTLRHIGSRPFQNTNIQALNLPSTVISIDGNPVVGCPFVSDISVDSGNRVFAAAEGMLYEMNTATLVACVPSATEITLPEITDAIADDAFAGCTKLVAVNALCQVPQAGDGIFADTPATLVTYADANALTSWKPYATAKSWLGREFKDIGGAYDDGSVVWSYSVADGVATVTAAEPAGDTPITSLSIPSAIGKYPVRSVGDGAFANCTSLSYVTIPSGIRTIGKAPFAGTAITSLTIPNTVTAIDGNPIAGCPFVNAIAVDANNTAFTASDGMLFDIDKTELIACVPSAKAVTLPATLIAIGDDAFAGCTKLLTVTALCEEPDADEGIFADTPDTLVTRADAYTLTSWQDYLGWMWKDRDFENTGTPDPTGILTYTDGSGVIWNYAVKGRKIVIGSAMTAISSLTEGAVAVPEKITVPDIGDLPVVEIGSYAFSDCAGITAITVPASVTNIVAGAFNGCTALQSFTVTAGNPAYTANYGALYTKDGECLVKIPACFRFKTTVTARTKITVQRVGQVVEWDEYGLPKSFKQESSGEATTSNMTVVSTYVPAVGIDKLLANVARIDDYAFCDCGTLPTGSSFSGTITVVKDGKKQDKSIGTFVVVAGTDATNTVETTTTTTGETVWIDKLPYPVMQSTVSATTYSSKVPVPTIPDTVFCPKAAWYGSVWYDQIPEDALPYLGLSATPAEVAKAMTGFSCAKLVDSIATAEQYDAFRSWAASVRNAQGTKLAGFDAVKANAQAWQAFAFDLDRLLTSELQDEDVMICGQTAVGTNGEIEFAVTLKDFDIGSNASVENLKKTFKVEGSESLAPLSFSEDNVSVSIEAPSYGKVRMSVQPAKAPEGTFFTRIGLQK